VLINTTPETVCKRIGAACNTAHEGALKQTFGEKLGFHLGVAQDLGLSRQDLSVGGAKGGFDKLVSQLDVFLYSGTKEKAQLQSLRNDCTPLTLPDKVVDIIIRTSNAETVPPGETQKSRIYTADLTVKNVGPWFWLMAVDDDLCISLAEDVESAPFNPGEKSKSWRERVYLKHAWRGYLVKNLKEAVDVLKETNLALTPGKKLTKAQKTQAAQDKKDTLEASQGLKELLASVCEGAFDLPVDVLSGAAVDYRKIPQFNEAVEEFLKAAAQFGVFAGIKNLKTLTFGAWIPESSQKLWKVVWSEVKKWVFNIPQEEAEAAPADKQVEIEKGEEASGEEDTYFNHPWNTTPTHFGVQDTLQSFKQRVTLVNDSTDLVLYRNILCLGTYYV